MVFTFSSSPLHSPTPLKCSFLMRLGLLMDSSRPQSLHLREGAPEQ